MDTQTIRIPTELKQKLEDMRTHPRQPIYEVIGQLLHSHQRLGERPETRGHGRVREDRRGGPGAEQRTGPASRRAHEREVLGQGYCHKHGPPPS